MIGAVFRGFRSTSTPQPGSFMPSPESHPPGVVEVFAGAAWSSAAAIAAEVVGRAVVLGWRAFSVLTVMPQTGSVAESAFVVIVVAAVTHKYLAFL